MLNAAACWVNRRPHLAHLNLLPLPIALVTSLIPPSSRRRQQRPLASTRSHLDEIELRGDTHGDEY
jgi:hypothetical protein